ncbi:MAG TPA: hypothetical protein VFX60_14650 [Micromonospora sp.]|nr:hypothetical protein [Micromonospora sp.]
MKWNAPSFRYDGEDRVTFPDLETIQSQQAAVVSLVDQWVRA